jgi:hypothetical protein
MKRKTTYILIIIVSTLLLHNILVQADDEKTVIVQAADGWQNSGIYLRPGDMFTVKASGKWVSGSGHNWYGPEGWGYGTITNDALVGWISKSRPPKLGYNSYKKEIVGNIIMIGKGGTFKSGNGYLYLAMGEWSGCHECRGKVTVTVRKW